MVVLPPRLARRHLRLRLSKRTWVITISQQAPAESRSREAEMSKPRISYVDPTTVGDEAMLGEFGHKPFTVVGGGDTVGYVQSRNLTDAFNHVSTGGSASLEVMAGHKLPAVEALLDKK